MNKGELTIIFGGGNCSENHNSLSTHSNSLTKISSNIYSLKKEKYMRTSFFILVIGGLIGPSFAANKKMSVIGKATFALPQRVSIQDTVEANKIKEKEPILAMMNFRYLYIGFGEATIETYNTNGTLGGEISFQYLQQQGLMGMVDHLNTKTAKLENVRLNKDTLWFLFRFNQYSEQQKGFLSFYSGKRILGIPSTLAYRVPCNNRLPAVHSIDGVFQVLFESNMHGIPGPSLTAKFRACLDSLSSNDLRGWENEVKEYKFVSDSVIEKISGKAK